MTTLGYARRAKRQIGAALTMREVEAMELLCEGLRTKAIADRLGVSFDMAKTHLHHAFTKLDAATGFQAAAKFAERRRLRQLPVEIQAARDAVAQALVHHAAELAIAAQDLLSNRHESFGQIFRLPEIRHETEVRHLEPAGLGGVAEPILVGAKVS